MRSFAARSDPAAALVGSMLDRASAAAVASHRFCPQSGKKPKIDATFCGACGSKMK
jgi:hypothetical protein